MNKYLKITIWVTVVVVLAGIIVVNKLDLSAADQRTDPDSTTSNTDTPTNEGVYVKAFVANPVPLREVLSAQGTLLPNEEVMLAAEASGLITSIRFKEGEFVKKGQLLFTLNDGDLQARLQQIVHEIDYLTKKEERESKLLEKGGISEEQYQMTFRDLSTKKAEKQEVAVLIAQKQIRAPFSGLIGLRQVSEGAYITPATMLTNLIDSDPLKIEFSMPEKYMGMVQAGIKITFEVEGTQKLQDGIVYAIEPKIDPATRSITIRAKSPNPDQKILPGAFAKVQILIREVPEAIAIPTQAIIPEVNRKKVYVVNADSVLEREVITGLRTPDRIEILEGLQAGDTVIISGVLNLRQGTKVNMTDIQQDAPSQAIRPSL